MECPTFRCKILSRWAKTSQTILAKKSEPGLKNSKIRLRLTMKRPKKRKIPTLIGAIAIPGFPKTSYTSW
jgi:hypothetical protein